LLKPSLRVERGFFALRFGGKLFRFARLEIHRKQRKFFASAGIALPASVVVA
jgi:hypothetical protein